MILSIFLFLYKEYYSILNQCLQPINNKKIEKDIFPGIQAPNRPIIQIRRQSII